MDSIPWVPRIELAELDSSIRTGWFSFSFIQALALTSFFVLFGQMLAASPPVQLIGIGVVAFITSLGATLKLRQLLSYQQLRSGLLDAEAQALQNETVLLLAEIQFSLDNE